MPKPALLICVDYDYNVLVYPANEETEDAGFGDTVEFKRDDYATVADMKLAAELFAQQEAKRIGADYGCNY